MSDSSDSDEKGETLTKVKEEPKSDTIKNYAESTMNELLGLFGYEDKVNSTDTENLNLDNYTESKENGSDVNGDEKTVEKGGKSGRKSGLRLSPRSLADHTNLLAQQHMNLVTALKRREQAELAERSSEVSSDREGSQQCAWCKKPGNKQFSLETSSGHKIFCSEVCFNQCRRASFKKSKVCDWCKHVRHTVNYVEFQDGEAQLQFCSEKCLNQYKMSIFCKETQEHLQALNEKGEEVTSDKHGERSILITPELWMNGENAKRAAEARETALDRMSLQKKVNRGVNHKSNESVERNERSKSKHNESRSSAIESARLSLIERIKTEASLKPKKSSFSKDTDRSVSPSRSELSAQSPQPQIRAPSPFLHPGMVPWFQHAQLLGSLGPGMPPLSGYQPVILPGFFPAFPPGVVPDVNKPSQPQENESSDREKRSVIKKDVTSHNSRLLSPSSGRSSVSDTNNNASENMPSARSPGIHERRTSSLFPIDFPQMFSAPGFPGPPLQPPIPGMPGARLPPPQLPGMPPATMMFPFPVVLPLPVPVPVPIPLTMDTLTKHFGKSTDTQSNIKSEKQSDRSYDKVREHTYSPSRLNTYSPQSVVSTSSEMSAYERHEPRSRSRGSCPDLSRTYGLIESRLSVSEPLAYKRSRTPDNMMSLDLSKNSKIARYDYTVMDTCSNDGVIDLSASRDNGHRSEDSCSESGRVNGHLDSDERGSIGDTSETYPEDGASVPKIHIITHRDETPLNQPLPLPPVDNTYSKRRGLILDAPSIPKKSRSPSPERRVYVRNVPRDLIEAARRRCLRTRIRTK